MNFKITSGLTTFMVSWTNEKLELSRIKDNKIYTLEVDLASDTTVGEFAQILQRMQKMPDEMWCLK